MNRIFLFAPFPMGAASLLFEVENEWVKNNIGRFVFDDIGEYGNQVASIDVTEQQMGELAFAFEGTNVCLFWSYPHFNEKTGEWENSIETSEFSHESELTTESIR